MHPFQKSGFVARISSRITTDQPGSIPFRHRLRARQTTLRVECSPRARRSYVLSENASNWTIGGPETPRPLNAPHPRSQAETRGPSQSHDEPWVLIGTQALLRRPPAAREGQEEERDNERHHSITIGSQNRNPPTRTSQS
ncbi:hypothetical protein L3X38_009400 [Prunus dulcis]|uniref:Uncharacterized protein n=1 Tax=Prunus dulcis TaxID=3755 RepID=A0AAD4WDG0_PRUDU|nr:hypothetical protein L3X38_009400 [Prunus dulcis]